MIVKFAYKPNSALGAVGAISAFALAPNSTAHLVDLHLVVSACNNASGGGPGVAVRTALLSAHGMPALPAGTVITVNFTTSAAQAATAEEFAGLTAVNTLNRTERGPTPQPPTVRCAGFLLSPGH